MTIRSLLFFPTLLVVAVFSGIAFADTTPQAPTPQAKKKKKKKKPAIKPAAARVAKPAPNAGKPMKGKIVAQSTSGHFVGTVAPSGPVRAMARRNRKAAR